MKKLIGVLLIVMGITLGLYLGIWVMFVGGIAGIIDVVANAINGQGISGMEVAINVAKIMFAGFVGYLSAILLIAPGVTLIGKGID